LVEISEVLGGVRFVLDCDLVLGEVIHDYLTTPVSAPSAPDILMT
jgi:hypothetical protein